MDNEEAVELDTTSTNEKEQKKHPRGRAAMMAGTVERAKMAQDRSHKEWLLLRGRSPLDILWWEWGKMVGALGLILLVVLSVLGCRPSPIVVAIILHAAIDFTFQTEETAQRKVERGRHLVCHSLVAGGLPLLVAGLVAGCPVKALVWMVLGVLGHYLVDWTRRFGLRSMFWAVLADQVAHLILIFGLVLWT